MMATANSKSNKSLIEIKRNNGGAHEAAHRSLFTCVIPVLGCSVTTGCSAMKETKHP